jgi:hypothetical protein
MRVDTLYPARLSRPGPAVPRASGNRSRRGGRANWLLLGAAAGLLVSELLGATSRTSVVLVVALVVASASTSLRPLRRRRAGLEPAWLAAQSEILRNRRFEVLRFTASEPEDTEHGRRTRRRVYDLAQPVDVAALFLLRSRAVAEGKNVSVTVEFAYPTEDVSTTGLERVRADLTSIPITTRAGAGVTPRVRFPAGRYLVHPETDPRVTYWVLGPPSLTVAEPAPGPAPLSSASSVP